VHSALETFVTMRYINLHLLLPLPLPLELERLAEDHQHRGVLRVFVDIARYSCNV